MKNLSVSPNRETPEDRSRCLEAEKSVCWPYSLLTRNGRFDVSIAANRGLFSLAAGEL